MKFKALLLSLIFFVVVFSGCGKNNNTGTNVSTTPSPTTAGTNNQVSPTITVAAQVTQPVATPTQGGTDVVTTASIVNTEEAFLKAISKNGTWIIALTQDLSTDKELLLEGEFKNGKKDDAGKDVIQRKIALYTQDENRTITARFTLTAPKMTVSSPMASIQHGTFKGDLYIDVTDFQLVDATVEGNVYFANEKAKSTFKMDDKSKITGKQEIQQ